MTINKLIEALQKYDGELEVTPVSQIPKPQDKNSEMLEKFGLQVQHIKAEVVGSVLDVGLVVLKFE